MDRSYESEHYVPTMPHRNFGTSGRSGKPGDPGSGRSIETIIQDLLARVTQHFNGNYFDMTLFGRSAGSKNAPTRAADERRRLSN